jgi:hypothetical protein
VVDRGIYGSASAPSDLSEERFVFHVSKRNPRLGIIPLGLPLVLEVTVDPVLAVLAFLAFSTLLLFVSLFSPVAHCYFLSS